MDWVFLANTIRGWCLKTCMFTYSLKKYPQEFESRDHAGHTMLALNALCSRYNALFKLSLTE